MGTEIIIDSGYEGYVFLGWAEGLFETQQGEKRPYYNMYVVSPVSSWSSEDYKAAGLKAEKKKCISADVWNGLNPGDRDRKYFGCISVHYNGREDMGVWCEMSGQGCRNFEDLTTLVGKWESLFEFIHGNALHMTRLDVAYDDHTGILDIERVAQDTQDQRYVSRMSWWEVVRSGKGISCQIGSPKSKVLVRIYDKAAERGYDDGRHWVRVELQLRDGRAEEFSKIPMPIGEAFAGVLLNYLRFVEPDETDSNKSRWQTAEYWANLIGDVGRIQIFTVPGGAYNVEKCRHYVFEMAGNAIDAMLQIYDLEDFLELVEHRECKPNPKYDLIVKEYHARQEAWALKVRSWFTVDEDTGEVL